METLPSAVPSVPAIEEAPLRPLDPRVRLLWVLAGLVGALAMGALAGGAEVLVLTRRRGWPLPPGAGALAVAALLAANALVFPWLRYRAWRWALRRHDLLLCYGVVWKVRRSVPRSRIQHVDVESGPLERAFGLATLTVYTAGTGSADARVPGLAAADAEALRETLLAPEGPDA